MATAAPPAPPAAPPIKGVQPLRAGEGHSFFWHKLHSLTGIIPIGAFLVEHIISNFETLNGPLAYAQQVKFLNSLPLVRVLEWVFIFIPLAFHAGYGVFIAARGRSNVNVYPWAGNWIYLFQRITGLIAFVYIIQHVWRQRFSGISLPEHPGAAFHKVQVELSNPWMLAIYVIAMIATTWHFAYGVWLFAAKWGITPGEKARKKFGYVCAVIGIALCLMGLASIYAVVTAPEAPEDVMPEQAATVVKPILQKSDLDFQTSNHPLLREASFVVTHDPAAVPIVPMADHLLQKFYPRYPHTAITDRVSGLVTVEALIGSDGTVEELEAKGPFDLQKEALRAIALWIYKPYLVDGHPTEVRTLIKIRYVLGTAKPSDTNDVDMAVDTQEQPAFLTKIAHSPKRLEPGMVRVSPFDMLKYVQTQVKPDYPKHAKKAGVTGIVIVDVTVDQTGKVLEAEAVAGPSMFYSPATEAVRQWTFKPYLDNGQAKEVVTSILVHFE